MTFEFILLILLSLVPSYQDTENWQQRTARMTIIAHAIDDAASFQTCTGKYGNDQQCKRTWPYTKKELVMFLITIANEESHFARHIHEGNCKDHQCDPSINAKGEKYFKARSLWQIQKTGFVKSDEEWKRMLGSSQEATTTAAHVAARIIRSGRLSCGTVKGVFSLYAGIGCGNWDSPRARNRFKMYNTLMYGISKRYFKSLAKRQEKVVKEREYQRKLREKIRGRGKKKLYLPKVVPNPT